MFAVQCKIAMSQDIKDYFTLYIVSSVVVIPKVVDKAKQNKFS